MTAVPTKTELIDLFWRSVWTFNVAFIGGLVGAGTGWVNIGGLDAAKLAAIGAVLTGIKVYSSNKLGTGTGTAKSEATVGLNPVASNSATPAQ